VVASPTAPIGNAERDLFASYFRRLQPGRLLVDSSLARTGFRLLGYGTQGEEGHEK